MIARCDGGTLWYGDTLWGQSARARPALSRPVRRLRHNARQLQDAVEMRDSRLSGDLVSSSPALSTTERMKTSSL